MIFLVRMDVTFRPGPDRGTDRRISRSREGEYSQPLQHSGKMAGIWRIVGEYANHSLFDVVNPTTNCTGFSAVSRCTRT